MIYARYSTDLQSERSVDDQIRLCRDFAKKAGLSVVESYHDQAKSRASTFGTNIMQEAENCAFEVLIAEAPDRISRDMADLAGIHKALEFGGISIECVNGGARAPRPDNSEARQRTLV